MKKTKIRNEKISIIREKKKLSDSFNVDFIETAEVGNETLDFYELSYYIESTDSLFMIRFQLVHKAIGSRYSKREILIILFEEMFCLNELLNLEDNFEDDYILFRINQLKELERMIKHLFDLDYDKLYYLYGENADVGETSADW